MAYGVAKKLGTMYVSRTMRNKLQLVRDFVNIKYVDGTLTAAHLNESLNILILLKQINNSFKELVQDLLVLGSLQDI